MEFLVLWFGTLVATFGMEIVNELRMFKDAADAGYKINKKKLSELGKEFNPNATQIEQLLMLIPIVNIMQVFKRTIQYNNVRPMILDQLRVIDALEEMSEIEKKEYLKNPTGLNAYLIPLKMEIRMSKATSIKINVGNESSVIYYEIGESLDDITILKVTGSASRLTVEEQKKKVVEAWETVVQAGMEKYGDKETLITVLKNNTNIDLRDTKENKKVEEITSQTSQELSVSEQNNQTIEIPKDEDFHVYPSPEAGIVGIIVNKKDAEEVNIENKHNELDDKPILEIVAESAQIKSIKLRRVDDENSYFEVELVDEEGKSIGVFGSPYITDPVNFRREVFGLLNACGTNDFLKLGGQENTSIPITFKCNEREDVIEIHNSNNQTFHQTADGKYTTEPTVTESYEKYEGTVNNITSASGVIEMIIRSPYFTTFYRTGNIYYGFGYPLISSTNNPELIQKASNHYKEYMENLLQFLGTDDLLKMGGEIKKLPQVLIERDEVGNIIAIGQEGKENHLRITDNNYKIEKGRLVLTDKNKSKKLI